METPIVDFFPQGTHRLPAAAQCAVEIASEDSETAAMTYLNKAKE